MAIKIRTSQVRPTEKTAAVESNVRMNPGIAKEFGGAVKKFGRSVVNYEAKLEEENSRNEVLKTKDTVINGNDSFDGIAKLRYTAEQFDNPKEAEAYYKNGVKTINDNLSNNFKHRYTKKLYNNWIQTENIKDLSSIKLKSHNNLITNHKKLFEQDLDVLAKQAVYGQTENERIIARTQIFNNLETQEAIDLYGGKKDELVNKYRVDLKMSEYKRDLKTDPGGVLKRAKSDKLITKENYDALLKLNKTNSASQNAAVGDGLKTMLTQSENGIKYSEAELAKYETHATIHNNQKQLTQIKNIKQNYILAEALNSMSRSEIKNELMKAEANMQAADQGEGTNTEAYKKYEFINKYLNRLDTELDKDPISAASKRGYISLDGLNIKDYMLNPTAENTQAFKSIMQNRSAIAKAVSTIYGSETKFFTLAEKSELTNLTNSFTNKEQFKSLATLMVEGFGDNAPMAFAELSKDNEFLAHIGGLMLIDSVNPGIDMALDGYFIQKNKNIDIKISDVDKDPIVEKYRGVFPNNLKTLESTVQFADNIYASMMFRSGKGKAGVFHRSTYVKAMELAIGQNGDKGGVEKYNGYDVHVPAWLERDDFDNIIEFVKENPNMLSKATTVMVDEMELPGQLVGRKTDGSVVDVNIFEGGDPYLISVGYGKYLITMYNHPSKGDAGYVIDGNFTSSGNNYAILDLNKIKSDFENRKIK